MKEGSGEREFIVKELITVEEKRFRDKVVLVTGATSGIGRTTAVAFAREGARVVTAARREKLGESLVEEITQAGDDACFIKTDIRNPDEIDNLFNQIFERYDRLDIAFNNGGISHPHIPTVAKTTVEEWDEVIETNARGTWLCMKHEINRMLKQGGGIIVNTSSILGFTADYGLSHYCASKHAILALTRTAALEYASKNIRINAVCPGPIQTEILERAAKYIPNMYDMVIANTAMKRIGDTDEISGIVLWLCSDEASYMIGKEISVDGGQSI